jgi:hypothetical protein
MLRLRAVVRGVAGVWAEEGAAAAGGGGVCVGGSSCLRRGMAFLRKGAEDAKSTERKQRREVETGRMMEIFSKCLEPPPFEVPKLTPEEAEAGSSLARTYAAQLWRRHNEQHKDLQFKIRARMMAVWALPTEELRREALLVTDVLYPAHARRAEIFPPEKGFQQDRSIVQDPRLLEDSRFARMVKEEAALGQDVGAELLARASAKRTELDEGDEEEDEEEEEAAKAAAAKAEQQAAQASPASAAPAAKAAPAKPAKAAGDKAAGDDKKPAAAPAASGGGKDSKKKNKPGISEGDFVV